MCVEMQAAAVVAVGAAEGLGQVNWHKVAHIMAWWFLGPLPLMAAASFIYWQGLLLSMHLTCAAQPIGFATNVFARVCTAMLLQVVAWSLMGMLHAKGDVGFCLLQKVCSLPC